MKEISYSIILKLISILLLLSALLFIWLQMFHLRLNPNWYKSTCIDVVVDQQALKIAQNECGTISSLGEFLQAGMGRIEAQRKCVESKNIQMKKQCQYPKFFLPAK